MALKKCIVAGCIITKEGKVLLVRHKKLGVWLYPGGHVEENEQPHEAAKREAFEETGMRVRLVSCGGIKISAKEAKSLPMPFVILLEHVPYKTGAHSHFDLVYVARPIGGKATLNKKESTSIGWFSKEQIPRLKTFENVKEVLLKFFESC
ncbi:MAG: NUDIX hydrolase [Candidatus Micrarchaeia archaeon]